MLLHADCHHSMMCVWHCAGANTYMWSYSCALAPSVIECSASVGNVHPQEERPRWCLIRRAPHGPRVTQDRWEPKYEQNGLHHKTIEGTWGVQGQGLPVIQRLRLELHLHHCAWTCTYMCLTFCLIKLNWLICMYFYHVWIFVFQTKMYVFSYGHMYTYNTMLPAICVY